MLYSVRIIIVFFKLCFKNVTETDNGSSVEHVCSGHCVPVAD
jgi:hypothetical protein